MDISKELIGQVARNARLNLTEEEKVQFLKDFKDILDAFASLDEMDSDNASLAYQPLIPANDLREDIPNRCLSQEEALENTSQKKDGYFKSPKVM